MRLNGGLNISLSRFSRQYHKAQLHLDRAVLDDTEPYVPAKSGALYEDARYDTYIGQGEINYLKPYARRQYYGYNFNYTKTIHPQAQCQWFEASKAVNKDKWIANVKKIAGGGWWNR